MFRRVMSKKPQVLFFLVLTAFVFMGKAQTGPKVKYWIRFKDKTGTPYSLSNPSAFLTQKAIARRSNFSIPYHISDLPVNPNYIKAIDTIPFVDVVYASKWLNGVVIVTDSSKKQNALAAVLSFDFVQDTNKVKRYNLTLSPGFNQSATEKLFTSSNTLSGFDVGRSAAQINQLNLDCLHNYGFRGQGMTIAVMDVGFISVESSPVFDSLRNSNRILGTRDFVSGGTNVYQGGSHGTMVLSCMAAIKPGLVMGTAPLANYWLLRTEDGSSETITEEYNWVRAAEFADSVGVDILTTSLGYNLFDIPAQNHYYAMLNGRTAPMSIAATMAARKGMFVLNAAGNEGGSSWKYITVPADADSICTVGAVDTAGVYADFSSVGPTADGRIKPDLMATGARAWVCQSGLSCFPGNGTSFATPVLAGAVACFWQSRPWLNNMAVLDTLKKRGSNSQAPNNKMGWGIPKLESCVAGLPLDFIAYHNADKSLITIKLIQTDYSFISIDIVDLLGQRVFTSDIPKSVYIINLSGRTISEGIYIVTVKTSNGTKTKKFFR